MAAEKRGEKKEERIEKKEEEEGEKKKFPRRGTTIIKERRCRNNKKRVRGSWSQGRERGGEERVKRGRETSSLASICIKSS